MFQLTETRPASREHGREGELTLLWQTTKARRTRRKGRPMRRGLFLSYCRGDAEGKESGPTCQVAHRNIEAWTGLIGTITCSRWPRTLTSFSVEPRPFFFFFFGVMIHGMGQRGYQDTRLPNTAVSFQNSISICAAATQCDVCDRRLATTAYVHLK